MNGFFSELDHDKIHVILPELLTQIQKLELNHQYGENCKRAMQLKIFEGEFT